VVSLVLEADTALWSGTGHSVAELPLRLCRTAHCSDAGVRLMRIRIVRRPPGEVDGVDLHRFEAGAMYDVTASIATYLMVGGYAEPVADTTPARVVPIDMTAEIRNRVKQVSDKAAEISRKKKRRP